MRQEATYVLDPQAAADRRLGDRSSERNGSIFADGSTATRSSPAGAEPPVLDRRGLAARWGVSSRSIARLEASGTGPRAFRIGRLVRWTLDEVRRFESKVSARRGR